MTARQSVEIEAYANMEGDPQWQENWRMAQICSTIMASVGSRVSADAFMPKYAVDDEPMGISVEDAKAMVEGYNRAAAKMRGAS